jgi:PAS domain S-box-containing protein
VANEVSATPSDAPPEADKASRLIALEASLHQREFELEEAQRIACLGTFHWDFVKDVVTWSSQVFLTYGIDPGQPPPRGDDSRKLHAPESWVRLIAAIERTKATGEPYALDLQMQPPDGSLRWVAIRGEVASWGPYGEVQAIRGTVQNITERKLAELALAERERQLQEAHRIARLGNWSWDAPADKVVWSEEVYRAFGLEPGQDPPSFDRIRSLHTPRSRSRLEALVRRALTTGEPYEHDMELVLPDGSRRWIIARGEVAARGPEGQAVALRGTIQDITERKLAEDTLRETQARFQKLYDANLMGICYPDRFGQFFDGNDEFLRIVGYTREDLDAGLVRWDTMTPPEYAELDAKHIAEAALRGSCTPYEKEYIRKDGRRTPILCGYALLEGSTDEYIGFISDLTPQKEAKRAEQEREMQFRELAESLPQLVWASDPHGDRVYTNRRYTDYTGIPDAKLLGSMWRELVHPDDLEHTDRLWAHCTATGEPYLNEYRIRRHDGVYRSFLVRGVPVRNAAGEIERWLGSATDIHDQKLAEEAVRRTEKLAAAGRLAAAIAHEINNPLAAVTNSLYLALLDPNLSEITRNYLRTAEQELARAAHVTTQTLQFHRQSTAPALTELSEIMDSAVSLFAPRFKACEIDIEREYAAGTALYCCGDELRQVFANLLSNALDATRNGGRLRIRIRAAHAWDGANTPGLRVSVGDTGSGIPKEVRTRIFEPFLSTKELTGTGLGLWVSEGIVHKHKGSIRLRHRTEGLHRGTVFSIFFPLDGLPQ